MRRCNREPAAGLAGKVFARAPQVVLFHQQALDDPRNHLAGLGQSRETLSMALENHYAQLVFQLADLATYAGLGGE